MNSSVSVDDLIAQPLHCGRNWQSCDWYYKNVFIAHERTVFPHNVFKEIKSFFYSAPIYTDITLAKSDSERFKGEIIELPYADPTLWGLCFNNLEQALNHCKYFSK